MATNMQYFARFDRAIVIQSGIHASCLRDE